MTLTLVEDSMAKEKDEYMSVKLTVHSLKLAKIAAATRGETLAEYASRVIEEHAKEDIGVFNRGWPYDEDKGKPEAPKGPKRPKG